MPHVATSPADLIETIAAAAHLDGDRLVIDDERAFRDGTIRDLAWTAAFSDDEATTTAAQWLIWEASQELGALSASIHELYMARGRGEVSGFTVPAINLRAQTFDMARTVFDAAQSADVGAVILEIARSEQTYTYQRPIDFATSVLAGAIAANWRSPVFIQGDHYQFNAKKYAADPEAMTEEIRRACRLAIDAGYRNIDIDSSTLVDLSNPTVDEQQRENYTRAAELTALIRSLETDGVTISVGGEIGEVGHKNSTVEELRAYIDGFDRELAARAAGAPGLSKVSVQTGTSHGGVPLPGGGVAEVNIDFDVLRELGDLARSCGMAGAVQHGASTLPDELFHRFRAVETAEIHLATGFQNLLYEHPAFPEELHRKVETWVFENAADERKPEQTDQQFVYMTRKKAIGPFKRELWDLGGRDEILAAQRRKFSFLFTELGVNGSREMVDAYIRPVELHRPIPDALRGAVAAR
jgi:fructose/tagatose bisphosphate aldolase